MIDLTKVDTNRFLDDKYDTELKEVIEEFYDKVKRNDTVGLWGVYERIYYEAKDSWKAKIISLDEMRDIQEYFRGIVNG